MEPKQIVVLTGAGISAESGLGTFRDKDGAWAKFDPMELCTPEGFARNPDKVHAFYNGRRADLLTAQPNAAHYALAALERQMADAGGQMTIVTQNIDDLHERAGSTNVLHMHGELRKARCEGPVRGNAEGAADRMAGGCGAVMSWDDAMGTNSVCPACQAQGTLRPHVVWFHEMPLYLDLIGDVLDAADMFVSIGTSGTVWPAAGFVMEAKSRGIRTVELNLDPSDGGAMFDQAYYGAATKVVPEWVASMGGIMGGIMDGPTDGPMDSPMDGMAAGCAGDNTARPEKTA